MKAKKEYPAGEPAGPPLHPGAVLREDVLPALRITVSSVAKELGVSRQTLHRILAETHPVTPDMAVVRGIPTRRAA
ncbi:MAG: HigA family addiction module antitoxin [Candidatus Binatia bacterium]